MGTTLSNLQEQFAHDLHFLLKRNGHTTTHREVEDLVFTIGDLCPWIPEEGTMNPKEWSKISSCFHGQPRVKAEVISTCYKVQTCLQGARNVLFNPEFENNLIKQLPQILPPLPLMLAPSAAPLLDSKSYSDQPENTSWKTQDDLNALLPQATEIDNCLSMNATDACSETGCVISASPVLQKSAIAVLVTSELCQTQSIHELQSNSKDNEMDSLSAPWLVLNDCEALIKNSLPAEGLLCLQEWQYLAFKQAGINVGAEGVPINAFQSANQTAYLPPPVKPKLHDIPVNWDPSSEKIIEDLQDLFSMC